MTLDVLPRPRLASRTTLKLGGTALAEVTLTDPHDAEGLDGILAKLGGAPLVLGGGSNILARDGELPLTLVRPLVRGEPTTLRERPEGKVRVRVGAGVKLQRFAAWLATQGLDALAVIVVDYAPWETLPENDHVGYFMGASRARQLLAVIRTTDVPGPIVGPGKTL